MSSDFIAGERVRLLSDPGRVGVITDKVRERRGKKVHFVQFPDAPSWIAKESLERLSSSANDIYSLLEEGKFGRINDFRRNLTYIQLSGKLANIVYSMDTTNTEFYAYQYKPVLSFLDAPSKGILIADEVGLGKTIEAGLIWTEIRARFDARRLLIVCPAMLREKWKSELAFRFGIEATIVNASELTDELVSKARHLVPPGRALICSYDSIRPSKKVTDETTPESNRDKLTKLFVEQANEEPLIDLVIFDEAHKMRNPDSSTSKLGKLLRDISEHIILLSATPINLKSEDLYHLLNIVDQETFSNEFIFPSILQANAPLVRAQKQVLDRESDVESIRNLLVEAQSHYLLRTNNQLQSILNLEMDETDLADDAFRVELANRIEKVNLLSKVITRTRKADVKELRVVREPFAPQIDMSDAEQDLYQKVTEIVKRYAWKLDVSDGFLLATPQRQLSSCMYAAVKSWQNKQAQFESEQAYEDLGAEVVEVNSAPLMAEIFNQIASTLDFDELYQNDSKFNMLLSLLKDFFKQHPNEKIIMFSYFRGTIRYLAERLQQAGFDNEILMGGMKESKQSIIDRFKSEPSKSILIASEVASEGVDLQFCRILINYDLPWNPMKIEQRIGRIDRHGQQAEKINILNFCYNNTIDQRIYEKLYQRLNIFESSLGDMEAILGEELAALTKDLLSGRLTDEQEGARIEQTSLAIERLKQNEKELESQASNLIAHSGHILQEVTAAHEFNKRVTEEDLSIYVRDYLQRYCRQFEFTQKSPDKLEFAIKLPPEFTAELKQFISEKRLFGITKLETGERTQCVFINNVAVKPSGMEKIDQTHPLIQFIGRKLAEANESFMPIVAVKVENCKDIKLVAGEYVVAVKKMSFEGLHVEEKLIAHVEGLNCGTRITSEQALSIANHIRLHGSDWPEASMSYQKDLIEDKIDECVEHIETEFKRQAQQKEAENKDRLQLQFDSAQKHFNRQLMSQQNVLELHKARGRTGLIKATEGKINKIKDRFEQRSAELKLREQFKCNIDDVCCVLVKIN